MCTNVLFCIFNAAGGVILFCFIAQDDVLWPEKKSHIITTNLGRGKTKCSLVKKIWLAQNKTEKKIIHIWNRYNEKDIFKDTYNTELRQHHSMKQQS